MGLFDKIIGGGKRREFGEKLARKVAGAPGIEASTFSEGGFELLLRDGIGSYNAPLGEVFEQVQDLPDDEVEEALDGLVAQLLRYNEHGLPRNVQHAVPGLFPYVRERVYYDDRVFRELINSGQDLFVPHAVLADCIGVDLVWKNEDKIHPIEKPQLEAWGVSFDELMGIAVKNMQKYRTKRWTQPQSRVHVSPWRSPFDASMILFDEWISELRVIGDPVIMMPSREQVIVTGSSDLAGLTAMAEMVEAFVADGNRFLTLLPFTIRDKEVVPFALPASHNLAHRFKLMAIETSMRDYAVQKATMENWFEANGTKALVQEQVGFENQNTREVHTYCVWPSQGRPVYLPKADRIYFVDDYASGKVTRILPWDAVVETLGEAFQPLDVWPERYKVEGYPSEEQFRECVNNS